MSRTLLRITLAWSAALGCAGEAHGDYRPLWLLQDRFDFVLDGRNLGLRVFPTSDTTQVSVFAFQIDRIIHHRSDSQAPAIAPGDSILVLARGTRIRNDRNRYLLFLIPQVRRSFEGLHLPLYEGLDLACDKFVPTFSRLRVTCEPSRKAGADSCACAREAVLRYQDLVAARKAGREVDFLRKSLRDENTYVVLSAMGLFRSVEAPASMEWMAFLTDHPDYQVRYDLAESIPYVESNGRGKVGLKLLNDLEPRIQLMAAYALGRVGYPPAEQPLASILADPRRDSLVRAAALGALEGMDSKLLLPTLEQVVAGPMDSTIAVGFRIHYDRLRAKAIEKR